MMHSSEDFASAGAYYHTSSLASTHPQTRSFVGVSRIGTAGTLLVASLLVVGAITSSVNKHDDVTLNARVQISSPTQAAPTRPWSSPNRLATAVPSFLSQSRGPVTVSAPLGASTAEHGFQEVAAASMGLRGLEEPVLEIPSAPGVSACHRIWLARFMGTLSALALFMSTRNRNTEGAIAMAAVSGDKETSETKVTGRKRAYLRKLLFDEDPRCKTTEAKEAVAKEDKEQEARFKKWRNVGMYAAGFYFGCWALNLFCLGVLQASSGSLELSEEGINHVALGLAEAEKEMRYNMMMGREPTLSEADLMGALRTIGEELETEQMAEQLQKAANCISDSFVATLITLWLVINREQVLDTIQDYTKRFTTLNSVTQAFTLLLVTDIFCGYHSADGWDTVLKLAGEHYGIMGETYEDLIRVWIATVPVGLDVAFKFWVFKQLRTLAPTTQALLEEIE